MANSSTTQHKGGKKNRKWGRNAKRGQAQRYRNELRLQINKEARRQRTIRNQPNNQQARIATAEMRRLFDERCRVNNERRRLEVLQHLIVKAA